MSSNLPPGVTENMIPGNRPEDEPRRGSGRLLYADLTQERVDAIEDDEFLQRVIIKARDLGFREGFAHGQGDGSLADRLRSTSRTNEHRHLSDGPDGAPELAPRHLRELRASWLGHVLRPR